MPIIHNNRDVTDEIRQQVVSADESGDGTPVARQIRAAMPLSEVPSPKAGLRVISARGTPGRISSIRPLTDREVNIVWKDVVHGEKMILIHWENGKTSEFPHSKLEYVSVAPTTA